MNSKLYRVFAVALSIAWSLVVCATILYPIYQEDGEISPWLAGMVLVLFGGFVFFTTFFCTYDGPGGLVVVAAVVTPVILICHFLLGWWFSASALVAHLVLFLAPAAIASARNGGVPAGAHSAGSHSRQTCPSCGGSGTRAQGSAAYGAQGELNRAGYPCGRCRGSGYA